MASKVDMSLDELVQLKKKGGQQGKSGQQQQWGGGQKGRQQGWQGKGQGRPQGQQKQFQNGGVAPVSDLRDILAKKQKTAVVDLRAKLGPKKPPAKPKPSPTAFRTRPSRGTSQSPRFRPQVTSPRSPPTFTAPRRPRRSDPGPLSRQRRDSPPRLPSFEEAKKITVTVPGMTRAASEYPSSSYRREERLAAAIARSKESRQDSYMRGREEFLASAITAALGGGTMGGDRDRNMGGGGGGGFSRVPLRYSRSPSPVADLGYDSQYTSSRSSFSVRPKGLTTMTSMIISNLSDTVSKNDVAELCGAVGPVEAILMPAPGMAEVIFKFKDDALEAFKKYNQRNLDGQPMMCKLQTTSRSRMASSGYGQRGLTDSYSDNFYSHSSGFF